MQKYASVLFYHDGVPEFGPDIVASTLKDAMICADAIGAIEVMKLVQDGIILCGIGN